ncbi:MarR family winged helix-turn-helix transcriptional regulator [Leifsonia poae]|uniref:Transcriptional regulator n=1 Tax=Leifsonia poae TaxID=110933 RepID=A0A9W6M0C6_9MICO|nr:transcriptional regulator [Leifsonia poae]
MRAETRLYNALGDSLSREHGLATSQVEFLRYFRDHPGSRVADVAFNFAAGIGAISKGVDRLEARGLVVRHPNPADGRSSLVSLTRAGSEVVADAETTFQKRLSDLVSSTLTPDQVATVGAALATLRAALERDRIGVPVG